MQGAKFLYLNQQILDSVKIKNTHFATSVGRSGDGVAVPDVFRVGVEGHGAAADRARRVQEDEPAARHFAR